MRIPRIRCLAWCSTTHLSVLQARLAQCRAPHLLHPCRSMPSQDESCWPPPHSPALARRGQGLAHNPGEVGDEERGKRPRDQLRYPARNSENFSHDAGCRLASTHQGRHGGQERNPEIDSAADGLDKRARRWRRCHRRELVPGAVSGPTRCGQRFLDTADLGRRSNRGCLARPPRHHPDQAAPSSTNLLRQAAGRQRICGSVDLWICAISSPDCAGRRVRHRLPRRDPRQRERRTRAGHSAGAT
jgi:hypothetical protein